MFYMTHARVANIISVQFPLSLDITADSLSQIYT